jgi:hypothetical protein
MTMRAVFKKVETKKKVDRSTEYSRCPYTHPQIYEKYIQETSWDCHINKLKILKY